ncbi:MAG: hypothetical protein CVV64_04260 [Candidatus Wallbacteria bacterium HGW-Wallbacteria-1]|jgi:hypothetical protein|uniref:Uncharacterized protein n=1 Tax=Candidatus Wallbacteria bacterium HGW-Wallbacteria-1 TaxID=2013854 RepID=A0A2N1PRM6_9BACT|nr:MAG: hypothetical protein CVV64_04260 [Candidatus Wallbacteria bacterium HGW-Wallbacteria-1]
MILHSDDPIRKVAEIEEKEARNLSCSISTHFSIIGNSALALKGDINARSRLLQMVKTSKMDHPAAPILFALAARVCRMSGNHEFTDHLKHSFLNLFSFTMDPTCICIPTSTGFQLIPAPAWKTGNADSFIEVFISKSDSEPEALLLKCEIKGGGSPDTENILIEFKSSLAALNNGNLKLSEDKILLFKNPDSFSFGHKAFHDSIIKGKDVARKAYSKADIDLISRYTAKLRQLNKAGSLKIDSILFWDEMEIAIWGKSNGKTLLWLSRDGGTIFSEMDILVPGMAKFSLSGIQVGPSLNGDASLWLILSDHNGRWALSQARNRCRTICGPALINHWTNPVFAGTNHSGTTPIIFQMDSKWFAISSPEIKTSLLLNDSSTHSLFSINTEFLHLYSEKILPGIDENDTFIGEILNSLREDFTHSNSIALHGKSNCRKQNCPPHFPQSDQWRKVKVDNLFTGYIPVTWSITESMEDDDRLITLSAANEKASILAREISSKQYPEMTPSEILAVVESRLLYNFHLYNENYGQRFGQTSISGNYYGLKEYKGVKVETFTVQNGTGRNSKVFFCAMFLDPAASDQVGNEAELALWSIRLSFEKTLIVSWP